MSLKQYVYFSLSSRDTSAAEITDLLGIEPDVVIDRGSQNPWTKQPRPVHTWKIECRVPNLCLDEQITCVLNRLRPHTEKIAELVARLNAEDGHCSGAALNAVRYFYDTDEAQLPFDLADQESRNQLARHVGPELLESMDAMQEPNRNLFGWHLDRDVIDFLTATGTELDVDEYNMAPSDDDEDD